MGGRAFTTHGQAQRDNFSVRIQKAGGLMGQPVNGRLGNIGGPFA